MPSLVQSLSPERPAPRSEKSPRSTPAPPPTASARELVAAVGGHELAILDPLRRDLGLAVAELSRSAGGQDHWGPDEPLVVLVRALARLARVAPGARSERAAQVLGSLRAAR